MALPYQPGRRFSDSSASPLLSEILDPSVWTGCCPTSTHTETSYNSLSLLQKLSSPTMLLARVSGLVAPSSGVVRATAARWQPARRLLSGEPRNTFTRRAQRRATLKEQITAPAGQGGE